MLVDEAMWLGNAALLNGWRQRVLRLPPIRTGTAGPCNLVHLACNHTHPPCHRTHPPCHQPAGLFAGDLLNRHEVPFSCMWSDAFVPKPKDWPPHVQVRSSLQPHATRPATPRNPPCSPT